MSVLPDPTNKGAYVVYWETNKSTTYIDTPNKETPPDRVKIMIVQHLLDQLKIPIRIEKYDSKD